MKNKCLILMLISIICTSCSISKKNNTEDKNLRGKIKQVKEYSYVAILENENLTKGQRERYFGSDLIMNFNKKGKLISKKEINSNDKIKNRTEYKYNSKGKLSEEIIFNSKEELINKQIFNYDKSGSKLETKTYDNANKLIEVEKFEYDERGRLITEKTFLDRSLVWVDSAISDYDEEQPEEKKKEEKISLHGILDPDITTYRYTYYDEKNQKESNQYLNDTVFYRKTLLTFNKEKQLIEERAFDEDDKVFSMSKYFYDKEGNQIKDEWYKYLVLDTIEKFELTYDAKGNWVRKFFYKNDYPKFIIEREIKYF